MDQALADCRGTPASTREALVKEQHEQCADDRTWEPAEVECPAVPDAEYLGEDEEPTRAPTMPSAAVSRNPMSCLPGISNRAR
jgi:hypothetical protein